MSESDSTQLRRILELCKAGSRLPEEAVAALIAGPPSVEPLLVDLVRSRAVRDDAWGPLWAIVVLGERRSPAGLGAILDAMRDGAELIHEGAEFALLRYGAAAAGPVLRFLDENPGLEGRVHLYSVLARTGDRRALDYLAAQLLRDEDGRAGVAWSIAECRDPRAVAALEIYLARPGRRDPELVEALEAASDPETLHNPLLRDWRLHWTWTDEDEALPEDEEDAVEPAGEMPEETPAFQPRCYDVDCPQCGSNLEYDTSDGSVRVTRRGRVGSSRPGRR